MMETEDWGQSHRAPASCHAETEWGQSLEVAQGPAKGQSPF